MKTCPNCRLVSPDSALLCDCGHNFQTGALEQDTKPASSKKSAFVFGVDAASLVLAPAVSSLIGVGGAIPLIAIAAACFYASSLITAKISASSLSRTKRMASYVGLVAGYLLAAFVLFAIAAAVRR